MVVLRKEREGNKKKHTLQNTTQEKNKTLNDKAFKLINQTQVITKKPFFTKNPLFLKSQNSLHTEHRHSYTELLNHSLLIPKL